MAAGGRPPAVNQGGWGDGPTNAAPPPPAAAQSFSVVDDEVDTTSVSMAPPSAVNAPAPPPVPAPPPSTSDCRCPYFVATSLRICAEINNV